MKGKPRTIVVAGDVAIDWLQWSVKPKERAGEAGKVPLNWELYPGTRMEARPGGAMLLARLVGMATGAIVHSPVLKDIETISPEKILHSIVVLGEFPQSKEKKDEKNLVYRIARNGGYAGPADGTPRVLAAKDDDPNAEIVVLDDAGNGFRNDKSAWPKALSAKGKKPIVLLKMSRPLVTGQLWESLVNRHSDRLVVVISADYLRAEGADISRKLSWERTATELVWQMACNRSLSFLSKCRNLVVRFGLDGAIHYRHDGRNAQASLYYDPACIEGGFCDSVPGEMLGLTSSFVAALAARVVKSGLNGVGEGVRDGINYSRRVLKLGFGNDPGKSEFPGAEIFTPLQGEPQIADITIPQLGDSTCADARYWTILEDLVPKRLEEVAGNTAMNGNDATLSRVPVGRFGKLSTVDRSEIENYRSIRNLMVEYLEVGYQKRPLSIAVFGPPGSGKSFAVTQVAESVASDSVKPMEFNISQWDSSRDLVSALHQVRDVVLSGRVPLVFFDEFDSACRGEPLGWLKVFLDPMQSGTFKDGESTHPIGKAIFVFAGGTCNTLEQFCRERSDEKDGEKEEKRLFRDAKGPDFVSRLRGHVDIIGVNPVDENDGLCMVRRAVLLRALLLNKAKGLFDAGGRLRIDPGVLRAMIKVPEYRHGVRSMEAIFDMSMLAGRRMLEQSALPPAAQLSLHVDAEMFLRLMTRDVLFGGAREKLARAIHEKFLKDQKGKKPAGDPAMKPWDDLREDLKESNRQQADHMPEKLKAVGYGFLPVAGRDPAWVEFSEETIETLARMEHKRWVEEKMQGGWKYGPKKDDRNKIHPCIQPWEVLPKKEKDKDIKAVVIIPKFLAEAGFAVYELK